MKSKVRLSRYSLVVTFVILVALFVGCILTVRERIPFLILLSMYLILIVTGLIYAPVSICADTETIVLKSILRRRRLLLRDVESVQMFSPTMGAIRIIGSGGFMGYWGIFKEGDIGRYMAFYGKASDCFLLRLKNGDKYVLGCENPQAMANYIQSRLPAAA